MASTFDLKGTSLDSFKIGIGGPTLNRSGSDININSNKIITIADLPSSTILQVKTAEIGTEFFYSMPNSSAISQLVTASVTPASTTNKVLLRVSVNGLDITGGTIIRVLLRRGSTIIVERKIDCSLTTAFESVTFDYLDSPASTSSTSYDISIGATTTSNVYVNRAASTFPQGYSSLTVMEVGPGSAGGSGSGEINTASNIGVGGVGIFKQKTGVNLEFKNLNAGSTKVSITDDTSNNEVDVDVVEANLALNNIGGTLSISKGGTGSTSASAALTALGAASTTSLTTHTTDTSNPHSTTAAQVGNTTAQWNASKIQGVDVVSTAPTNGQVLVYSSVNSRYEPNTLSSSGSSENPFYGASGAYYKPFNLVSIGAGTTSVITTQMTLVPIYVPALGVDRLMLNVGVAVTGALIDAAVYNIVSGYPNTKIADLVTNFDCSAVGQKLITCNLSQGWYNIALIARTAAPNLTTHSSTTADTSFLPLNTSSNINTATFMRTTDTTFPTTIVSSNIIYSTVCPVIWVRTK